ncbi:MAG: hypothetical protein SGILL_006427 [Bacillariaceae sp.]
MSNWLANTVSGGGAAGVLASGVLLPQKAKAAENNKPIAILGASGRTGALCVMACLQRGIPVKALTRSGNWSPPDGSGIDNNPLLTVAECNVKDTSALSASLKDCRGVIYAASASKSGGNPEQIDNIGVVEAGKVCLSQSIARYVVISSTATTRPSSAGYIFTNMMVNGVMTQKRLGEVGVQEAYASSSSASSYTIVRPGGLEEPKENKVLGPSALEISQGDVLAGIVSRADLAEVSVELALSKAANLKDTAVELYYTTSAVPVSKEFRSTLSSGVAPRLHGDSYSQLFDGIRPDVDYYIKQ